MLGEQAGEIFRTVSKFLRSLRHRHTACVIMVKEINHRLYTLIDGVRTRSSAELTAFRSIVCVNMLQQLEYQTGGSYESQLRGIISQRNNEILAYQLQIGIRPCGSTPDWHALLQITVVKTGCQSSDLTVIEGHRQHALPSASWHRMNGMPRIGTDKTELTFLNRYTSSVHEDSQPSLACIQHFRTFMPMKRYVLGRHFLMQLHQRGIPRRESQLLAAVQFDCSLENKVLSNANRTQRSNLNGHSAIVVAK